MTRYLRVTLDVAIPAPPPYLDRLADRLVAGELQPTDYDDIADAVGTGAIQITDVKGSELRLPRTGDAVHAGSGGDRGGGLLA